jgi:hypothetical protein
VGDFSFQSRNETEERVRGIPVHFRTPPTLPRRLHE